MDPTPLAAVSRPRGRRALALAAVFLFGVFGAAINPGAVAAGEPRPGTPFVSWDVPIRDLDRLDPTRPQLLMKTASSGREALAYLDAAQAHHMKVILYYTRGLDARRDQVYPGRLKWFAGVVKNHPALYGYLTAKEPNLIGINNRQLKRLYRAYKSADARHPVFVLLGNVSRFNKASWSRGMADGLWIDWYPVQCSGYKSGQTVLTRIRRIVHAKTPHAPVWVLVQGHSYRAGCKVAPTVRQLRRQVKEAFRYAGADGIVWYTWDHAAYQSDFSRRPGLWAGAQRIMRDVRDGSF